MSRKMRYFGDLQSGLKTSVKPADVALGAIAGLAGVAAAKKGLDYLTALATQKGMTIPDLVSDVAPLIGSATAGAVLYFAQKQSTRAAGHLAGALAGGLAITAGGLAAKHQLPGFGGVVSVNLKGLVRRQLNGTGSGSLGLVTGDPRRQSMGLIQQNVRPTNARKLGLVTPNRKAALSRISGMRAD